MHKNNIVTLTAAVVAAWFFLGKRSTRDTFHSYRNALPVEVRKALETGDRFTLLSIDPARRVMRQKSDSTEEEAFHGYAVLGKIEIRDKKERAELLNALYKGIADSDGRTLRTFWAPRHGLSATLGVETVDLVLCFECLSMVATNGPTSRSVTVLTTDFPLPIFDHVLEKEGLPIAKGK